MTEEPLSPQRKVTIKMKQGRFEETQDLQLAILRSDSDARATLREMVAAWRRMGENDEAQTLELMYLQSNRSYSWRVERLDQMITEWYHRGRLDRAACLTGLYINNYTHGSDEMACNFSHSSYLRLL